MLCFVLCRRSGRAFRPPDDRRHAHSVRGRRSRRDSFDAGESCAHALRRYLCGCGNELRCGCNHARTFHCTRSVKPYGTTPIVLAESQSMHRLRSPPSRCRHWTPRGEHPRPRRRARLPGRGNRARPLPRRRRRCAKTFLSSVFQLTSSTVLGVLECTGNLPVVCAGGDTAAQHTQPLTALRRSTVGSHTLYTRLHSGSSMWITTTVHPVPRYGCSVSVARCVCGGERGVLVVASCNARPRLV